MIFIDYTFHLIFILINLLHKSQSVPDSAIEKEQGLRSLQLH